MAGHIWDDPDKAVDGAEKVAAQTASGDFGILISSIATYVRSTISGLASFVSGPASSTDGNFALFNGATGKTVKDSGVAIASAAEFKAGTAGKLVDAAVRANAPSFSVHKNGTDQTGIAASTFTGLTFGTEVYDVGNCFASNAWTPTAGKVSMLAALLASGTWSAGALIAVAIYKNGSPLKQANWYAAAANVGAAFIAVEDIANGTDVYDVRVYVVTSSGTASVSGTASNTYFQGHWICP
ncbi:hypothetical protein [Bradyrhizobium liaoningense]|uniref:hypothetical protein n=1 Tax=Bradyrhizobium liaoningense TaxID=43992 RepID=UPI001BA4DD83|nr:hypothetical protein [Bradyrhizobium liaoningense]MBR0855674.1 hypothetical protein [Bradyrhizobium liaoningense]